MQVDVTLYISIYMGPGSTAESIPADSAPSVRMGGLFAILRTQGPDVPDWRRQTDAVAVLCVKIAAASDRRGCQHQLRQVSGTGINGPERGHGTIVDPTRKTWLFPTTREADATGAIPANADADAEPTGGLRKPYTNWSPTTLARSLRGAPRPCTVQSPIQ